MLEIPHASYFEGILQLRNPNEEVIAFIKDTTLKDKRAIIVKEEDVNGGIDYYYSSQKYIQSLGKKLQQIFSGEYKVTSSLHTKSKMGKDLYRVTVLFRVLDFKKEDKFHDGDEEYEIMFIEKQITAKNTKTGEKKRFTIDFVKKNIKY